MEEIKYKIGTLGWIREQTKKDGFDNIRDWQNWKRMGQIKNLGQVEKVAKENNVEIKDRIMFYRFWDNVDIKDNIKECWNWTASTTQNSGYGQFHYGEMTRSNRIVYMLTKGPIPEGLQIQHLCNNRLCCNPNHLILGSPLENIQYMLKCGRGNKVKGESIGTSKLTENQVREILKSYNEQRKLHPELKQWQITEPIAKKFGISMSHITSIINGTQWPYIYEEFHK